jgi:hypothetical protein
MIRAALVIALVVAVAGCGGGRRAASGTELTLLALNATVGRAVFHLECGPAGGDLPNPARACAALARHPQLVTGPKPFVCIGGTFSWWEITISGRLDGAPVRRGLSTCWTPQMATLERLGIAGVLRQHLEPRRSEAVLPGTTHTFPPGTLRAADVVTCDILGHRLEAGVPVQSGPYAKDSIGFGGAGVTSVVLTVGHDTDGTVTASCHTGSQ